MKVNHKKRKRIKFIAVVALISLAALAFILKNFYENIVFFYSPTDLVNKPIYKKIRVGGLVEEGSVKKDGLEVEFVVTDLEQDLKIRYQGILPDLFRDKQGVVAEGFLDKKSGEFMAKSLLIKHDEKYMPPEVAKALKPKP